MRGIQSTGVFALLMIAGCAEPPRPPAPGYSYRPPPPPALSTEAVKAKADAWADCAIKKARELDDGRSDAATIAEPVRVSCRQHYMFNDNDDRGFAINVVLQLRKNTTAKTTSTASAKEKVQPWVTCVVGGAVSEDDGVSAAGTIADRIQPVCTKLYIGHRSEERDLVVLAVQEVRKNRASKEPDIIVSPPQKMPRVDPRL